MKRAWTNPGLMVTGSLVGLLLAEGLMRVGPMARAFERNTAPVWEFSTSRHHRLIPNASKRYRSLEFDYLWTNNALGMRDTPHPLHKPPGTFRVLLLGDSYVQGWGVPVEAGLARLLDSTLNRPKRSVTIEVMNAAVFGYGPFLERLYLQELIDPVQPDLVLVGFFLGNDVGDDQYYIQRAHPGPGGTGIWFTDSTLPFRTPRRGREPGSAEDPVRQFRVSQVVGYSRVATLVARSWKSWAFKPRSDSATKQTRATALVAEQRSASWAVNAANSDSVQRQALWAVTLGQLELMADLCRSRGARLVLLIIPPLQRLTRETEFPEPYQILHDFGKRHDVPVIDLLPSLLAEDPFRIHMSHDHHWTAFGHRLAAAVVDSELRRLDLLP